MNLKELAELINTNLNALNETKADITGGFHKIVGKIINDVLNDLLVTASYTPWDVKFNNRCGQIIMVLDIHLTEDKRYTRERKGLLHRAWLTVPKGMEEIELENLEKYFQHKNGMEALARIRSQISKAEEDLKELRIQEAELAQKYNQ